MPVFAFALALLAAEPATAAAQEPAPAAQEPAQVDAPWPAGAPRDDYQLVARCYGALRGYLDLHDQVMPEVTRIESTFRRPGSKLADDLKVYDDQQRQARVDLKKFQAALTAAEKASARPINAVGAEAVAKGRAIWNAGPDVTKARIAQEWMSWTLPARCQTTAETLATRAKLMSPALKANIEEATPAAETPAAPAPAEAAPADKPAEAAAEKPQG
jgi:hypothetical protein